MSFCVVSAALAERTPGSRCACRDEHPRGDQHPALLSGADAVAGRLDCRINPRPSPTLGRVEPGAAHVGRHRDVPYGPTANSPIVYSGGATRKTAAGLTSGRATRIGSASLSRGPGVFRSSKRPTANASATDSPPPIPR